MRKTQREMASFSNGSNGYFPANLSILDGKNWEEWCVKMEAIFGFQDVSEIVRNGISEEVAGGAETQTQAYKDFKKKDCKALFIIHQCHNSDNFAKIRSAKSAKDAWDILEMSSSGADKVKRVKLQSLRK